MGVDGPLSRASSKLINLRSQPSFLIFSQWFANVRARCAEVLHALPAAFCALSAADPPRGTDSDCHCADFRLLAIYTNLADVERIMRDLSVDGHHHRVRFRSNQHRFLQVRFGERLQRVKQALPSARPSLHELCPRGKLAFKLLIAVAPLFLPSEVRKSVHRESMLPLRCFTIREMLFDSGSGFQLSCSSETCAIAFSPSDL